MEPCFSADGASEIGFIEALSCQSQKALTRAYYRSIPVMAPWYRGIVLLSFCQGGKEKPE